MEWEPYSHLAPKRSYPDAFEDTQVSFEEPPSAPSSTQIDEPLCLLGSVVDVNAQLRKNAGEFLFYPPSLEARRSSIALEISPVGDYFEILNEEKAFAHLDKSFCSEARRLVGLGVRFQACLDYKYWEKFRNSWQFYSSRGDNATFVVDVHVYSLKHHADKVGSILLRSGIFLQQPVHNIGMEEYFNPQILKFDGFHEVPDEEMSESDETPAPVVDRSIPSQVDPKPTVQSADQEVEIILNSLSHTNILHEIHTDSNRIKSQIMGHQMTALDFIAQRESGQPPTELTFWREKRIRGEKFFQHVLTKAKSSERNEPRGGILADDMGLGKSLTFLSAIANTLHDASAFVSAYNEDATGQSSGRIPSRTTLIMVPSTTLIDNWIDEIRAHTYPHKVTFHRHIGTDRQSEVNLLCEKDVVFTTFATALEDSKRGQSPLSKIHWFRIVLDEAHKIRNRTTKQFQAVQQISAQRRWCVTGTPIQNRLEDLGSLVAFLRVPDLERAAVFRTCIIAPTLSEKTTSFQNLQILLKTICLRRTREILGLPEPIADQRELKFSDQERYQYDELYEHYSKQVQMAVSGVTKLASTTLQSIHELRLFCNNGPRKIQRELNESDDEILSYLQQFDRNICAKCSDSIFCIDPVGERNAGIAPPDLANHIGTDVSSSTQQETAFQYPSKLRRLLYDIKRDPGHKCIVFSSWKKTLDMASELLRDSGMKYDIIHGSLSLKQRLKVLKEYKSMLGPNILLMTLGTGSEGLNLTVATRIYLLEPQWNPFLELQAMARAQRIGQTEQVMCIRYVMRDTIEQSDVLNRQRMKTKIAGGGFKTPAMQKSLEYFGVVPAHASQSTY
ncbi:hypothetical protein DM02DRAFT_654670 [Periconia macrospinosa]|uniref:Uncharacterized protein n=1 Tax=Periconia macrospinosa TaxID=97972 RepID=A0A2V1DSZ9_9PLEO|nr:hypothetical protein DM02DRAFT_654670 [Periconia macrospinosa]